MTTSLSAESASLQNVHSTMDTLAERTGGKATYNRNDIDGAIRRSIEDGSTYYTLAYYPEDKNWNGKFRKIQVKVDRPKVKVRHRLGYYATDPRSFAEQNQKQQAISFGEALSLDSPVATALGFKAGVIAPTESTQHRVLVNFGVDPHAISFDPQSDGLQHAQLDCAVEAYSEKGKSVLTVASAMNVALKPDTYARVMKSVFPCQQYVDLPAGKYHLRLGVRDHRTGLIGTANAKVTVPPEAAPAGQPGEKRP
jgi:hypothetical protein